MALAHPGLGGRSTRHRSHLWPPSGRFSPPRRSRPSARQGPGPDRGPPSRVPADDRDRAGPGEARPENGISRWGTRGRSPSVDRRRRDEASRTSRTVSIALAAAWPWSIVAPSAGGPAAGGLDGPGSRRLEARSAGRHSRSASACGGLGCRCRFAGLARASPMADRRDGNGGRPPGEPGGAVHPPEDERKRMGPAGSGSARSLLPPWGPGDWFRRPASR